MYIEAIEMKSVVYPEIQTAITRGDNSLVNEYINEAMAFVQSKLSTKYDMIGEFAKTGTNRNVLLVKYVKDIAAYFTYAATETMPAKRAKAYDDAVEVLNQALKGQIVIAGLATAPETPVLPEKLNTIAFGGNAKRYNTL